MKRKVLTLIFIVISLTGFSQTYRQYNIQYISDGNGNLVKTSFSLKIIPNKITYVKNGNEKYWDTKYLGEFVHEEKPGIKFKYHRYYLISQDMILFVSLNKIVNHKGVSYYRLIIDGEDQLAL